MQHDEVLAVGTEFADEFVVLDTVDGEEGATFESGVLGAKLQFPVAMILLLRFVNGLSDDIVLGGVADPEEDMLNGVILMEGDTNDVFETLLKVKGTRNVTELGKRLYLIDTVEREVEDLLV